jgi:hypothetical protein
MTDIPATQPANPLIRSFLLALAGAVIGSIACGFVPGSAVLFGFILNPDYREIISVGTLAASAAIAGAAWLRKHRLKAWKLMLSGAVLAILLDVATQVWWMATHEAR